ncbi:MAG: DUF3164 family protein [Bacteroidota bacterium]
MSNTTQPTIDLGKFSPEELAALRQQLDQQEEKERKKTEAKRQEYEQAKSNLVESLISEAQAANEALNHFKTDVAMALDEFHAKLLKYGDVKAEGKGNYTLFNTSKTMKVEVSNDIKYGFDERATLAAQKITEFLKSTVKKKDKTIFELIIDLIQKDEKTGRFDPRKITKLYKYEDKFKDDNWTSAIRLFKESYQALDSARYFRFYQKDSQGKFKAIVLQFSSL